MESALLEVVAARVGSVQEMGKLDTTDVLPKDVIVWSLDFKVTGSGEIDIFYDRAARYRLRGPETIEDYTRRIVDGHDPTSQDWKTPGEVVPGKSPLSIHHTEYAYLVFVLNNKNWQFMDNCFPFSVENGKSGYYIEATGVWRDRLTGAMKYEYKVESGAKCRVAYFISKAQEEFDNSKEPGNAFVTRFNFYLDLIVNRKGVPRLLPTIVDPDVGHPGGYDPNPVP
ncbi:hypothetical protein [Sphingosinicella sp. BN140058]|uniref:hypothetical protein n=1 Tax=Sphingosinicella sp. BN140058 TaxID=1892855 RepID=UPI001010FB58|nr:hypothetical protein [Sphingosinicella sp. BN140058]QAY77381.1 hypothetical protein ETR14_13350 [Sphingosinicella sp. BN140058]